MTLPAKWTTVPVTGTYNARDGVVPEVVVSFYSAQIVVVDGVTVVPAVISATTVAGSFTVDLPATNDPDIAPTNLTYTVVETINGASIRSPWRIQVPYDSAGIDLSTVAPVGPNESGVVVPPGAKGDPGTAATFTFGTTTTGAPGSSAVATEASGSTPQARVYDLTVPQGPQGPTGGVTSVNTQTGAVVLGAADVGAEPAIAAGTTDQYLRGDKTWQQLAAAVLATALTGFSTSNADPVVAADKIIAALGKLQAQVSARLPLDGSAKMAGPYQWQYQTAGDFYNGIISQDYDFAGNKLRERRIGAWAGGTVCYAYDALYGASGSSLSWQWLSNGTPVANLTTSGNSAPTAEFQANMLTVRNFNAGGSARWRYSNGALALDITSPSNQYTGDVINVSSVLNSRAWTFFGPTKFGEYTLATLPSAATNTGYYITVTDATGGAKLCRSDGTNWNLVNTSTPVS